MDISSLLLTASEKPKKWSFSFRRPLSSTFDVDSTGPSFRGVVWVMTKQTRWVCRLLPIFGEGKPVQGTYLQMMTKNDIVHLLTFNVLKHLKFDEIRILHADLLKKHVDWYTLYTHIQRGDELVCHYRCGVPRHSWCQEDRNSIHNCSIGTLQGTNISPKNGILKMMKMIFLFPRWDMLIPWRVAVIILSHTLWYLYCMLKCFVLTKDFFHTFYWEIWEDDNQEGSWSPRKYAHIPS